LLFDDEVDEDELEEDEAELRRLSFELFKYG
jgi:hypothetical protein